MKIRYVSYYFALILISACAEIESGDNVLPGDDTQQGDAVTVKRSVASATGIFKLNLQSECENPCSLSVQSTSDIARVLYEADGWALGESNRPDQGFAIAYTFNTLGLRKIRAIGLNEWDLPIIEATQTIKIKDANRRVGQPNTRTTDRVNVPYFYQYDNQFYPGSSCQNTSLAMVLSYSGWSGVPDDITRRYGKSYAQSPAGLADLFNVYARASGLSKRIQPTTNGTIAGLKSELDRGQPVIIHGYFTRAGHVVVVLGYDNNGYYVNDPAGKWSQYFMGGYSGGGSGRGAYYSKGAFEAAVATANGYSPLPLWYHALR